MQFQTARAPVRLPQTLRQLLRLRHWPAAALGGAALALSGCSTTSSLREYVPQIVTPYRIDIQQGNFVTQDMTEQLRAGQTKDQVRFVLGTPLLTDVFHSDRWDYVFRSAKGWNDPEKRRLTVFFDKEARLARWEAVDVPPPANLADTQPNAAQADEKPGVLGRLFGWMTPSAAAPAATSAAAAAPDPAQEAARQAAADEDEAAKKAGVQQAAAQAVAQATVKPASAPAPQSVAEITSVIEQWRAAWSAKDPSAYLAFYAADFKPESLTRPRWEVQRRERLTKTAFIFVNLSNLQIKLNGGTSATATFTQQYESETVKEAGQKTLALGNYGGQWLIREETFKAR